MDASVQQSGSLSGLLAAHGRHALVSMPSMSSMHGLDSPSGADDGSPSAITSLRAAQAEGFRACCRRDPHDIEQVAAEKYASLI